MDTAAIRELLYEQFGHVVGRVDECPTSAWMVVEAASIEAVARFLRDDERLSFDCLSNLTGTDYPARGKIRIVYDLYSYGLDHSVTLKVDTSRERPVIDSLVHLWPAANWLEREVFDLLGVDFPGHPDLRRLLLPEDWEGHPLRKDYVAAPEYHGISAARESVLDLPDEEGA